MRISIRGVVGAVVGAVIASAPAAAQGAFDLQARGGVAIPVSDLGDVADAGGAIGLGLGYWFHPRIAIRIDGDVEILEGSDEGTILAPDLYLWHYGGGLQFNVTEPGNGPVLVQLRAGAGATSIDTESFSVISGSDGDIEKTYFSVNGGLDLSWDVMERVSFGVGGQAHITFADEEDTQGLSAIVDPSDPSGFSSLVSIPLHAFVRISTR